ncbi:MAG: hypothetical protein MSA09_11100 [Lachnospiraceae bacterium]|nr:hypothetical protein [Lachnospiraceae bacterium]
MGDNVNSVWAEHKELKQHIIKIENAAAKTSLFTQEKGIYQPVLENAQHYIDMNRAVQVLGAERLQKYHIRNSQEEMDDLVREHASRSGYVAKLDEKEKKRSRREKDVTARLGEGHTYFSQKPQELLAARDRIEADVKADRVDVLRKPLTGDEFALDPQTGGTLLPVETLLRKRAELAKRIKNSHSMNASANLRTDEKLGKQLAEEVNLDILQHLDEAIKLLYQANGCDEQTGKRVGIIKKKQAQKKFALAMEAYRDSVKHAEENECRRIVSRIEKSDAYKEKVKELEIQEASRGEIVMEKPVDLDHTRWEDKDHTIMFPNHLMLQSANQGDIVDVREMIRTHEDAYKNNQKLIDKLYQEMMQYYQEWTGVVIRGQALFYIMKEQNGGMEFNQWFSRIDADLHAAKGMNVSLLGGWGSKMKMAIAYLLEGKQPKDFSDHLFLMEHCGISTDLMNDVNADLERVARLREEGKTEEQISDMMYHEYQEEKSIQAEEHVRTELEQRKARIRQEGGNPDEDEEVQQKEKLLLVLSKTYFRAEKEHPEHIADREVLFSDQSAVEHYILKQDMYNKIFTDPQDHAAKRRIIGEDGKEKWIKRFKISGLTRDIVSNISSIENPGDCGMEKAYHYLDNIMIISKQEKSIVAEEEYEKAQEEIDQMIQSGEIKKEEREARLEERKKERYDERLAKALEEEMEMQRQEKERIETYLQEKDLKGLPEWPGMEELARCRQLTRPLFEKIQGLSYRMDNLFMGNLFEQFSTEMQQEILELHAFYGGVKELAAKVLSLYSKRAKGMSADPLKSMEQYIDEKRAEDQQALQNKAARASAA